MSEMFDKVEFTIDGKEFSYLPMMAKQSRDWLVQLINKMGPVVGEALKGLKSTGDFTEDSDIRVLIGALAESLGNFVVGFSGAVSPQFYSQVLDAFLARVTVNSDEGERLLKKEYRDIYFSRTLLLETKVLFKCLEVQYEDFFGLSKMELGTMLARLTRKGSSSISPQQSTGTFTESPQATDTTSH